MDRIPIDTTKRYTMIRLKQLLQELKQRDDKRDDKRDDNAPESAKVGYMFIGDSLSSEPGGFTWNGKLDKAYNLGATHVYKIGETTSWMAANALPIINKAPYGTFKKVIIWGGTNDAYNDRISPSSTISNLKAISNAVKAKGGQLFVFLGYDARQVMVGQPEYGGKTKNGTDYTQGTAREFKLRTIDIFDRIADGIGQAIIIPRVPGAKSDWAKNDGVHVSGTAHGQIAQHVWNWPGVKP